MRLSTALLFGFMALCGAISLPRNTTDGTYVVLIDESGNEIHKRISDPIVSIEDAPPVYDSLMEEEELHRRPIVWHIWCGCGFTLDHGHCDAAVADLKSQIGEKTQHWWSAAAWYSIRGSVVAFACARLYPYQGHSIVSAPLVTWTLSVVTKRCGWYIAGTGIREIINSGFDEATIGYMRWFPGLGFCKAAKTSPVGHC